MSTKNRKVKKLNVKMSKKIVKKYIKHFIHLNESTEGATGKK